MDSIDQALVADCPSRLRPIAHGYDFVVACTSDRRHYEDIHIGRVQGIEFEWHEGARNTWREVKP